MKSIQFRKCEVAELVMLRELSIETFTTAFGEQNTKEDMKIYVAEAFSLEKMMEELTNKEASFYFVEAEKKTIGYLKLNIGAAQSEPVPNGFEIERIYLVATYQGKGIGQLMMDKAFGIARQMEKRRVWLGVWERNYDAVRFYERNGFKKFAEHSFYLGKDLQTDWLMDLSI